MIPSSGTVLTFLPAYDRDDAGDDDGPEPMDTDAAEDAAAATAELLLEVCCTYCPLAASRACVRAWARRHVPLPS